MVMPRSRSKSLLSITRSSTCWCAANTPACRRSLSTIVVLPWSTCAMIAMLRTEVVMRDGSESEEKKPKIIARRGGVAPPLGKFAVLNASYRSGRHRLERCLSHPRNGTGNVIRPTSNVHVHGGRQLETRIPNHRRVRRIACPITFDERKTRGYANWTNRTADRKRAAAHVRRNRACGLSPYRATGATRARGDAVRERRLANFRSAHRDGAARAAARPQRDRRAAALRAAAGAGARARRPV